MLTLADIQNIRVYDFQDQRHKDWFQRVHAYVKKNETRDVAKEWDRFSHDHIPVFVVDEDEERKIDAENQLWHCSLTGHIGM